MKKAICLILAILMLFGLTACGAKEEAAAEKETVHIKFLSLIIGHPVYTRIEDAFKQAAAEYGFEVSFAGVPNAEIDKTIELVETAIAEGCDGIVMDGSGTASLIPVLTKAKEKGLAVGTYFIDVPDETLRCSFVLSDSENIGYNAAKALHEQLGGADMKMACISGSLDAVDELAQRQGVEKYCSENPGCELVVTVTDNWEAEKTESQFYNIISAYPEVNCIFGTNGVQATALAKGLADLGLDTKTMPTITMDDVDENLAALREGRLYGLMAQDFYAMGYLNGKYVFQTLMGEEGVPPTTQVPAYLVTLDNIDTYLDDWAKLKTYDKE